MGLRFCVDKPLNKAEVLDRRRSSGPWPLEPLEPGLECPVLLSLEFEFIFYSPGQFCLASHSNTMSRSRVQREIPQEYTPVEFHHAPRRYDARNDHPENRASVEEQWWTKQRTSTYYCLRETTWLLASGKRTEARGKTAGDWLFI